MRRLVLSGAFVALAGFAGAPAEPLNGTLYKDPNCGCCEAHAQYLREHGVTLEIRPVANLAEISRKAGIPAEYHGCHTIMLEGYAIEGHVSIGAIEKLLAERPADVVGISMPGMPPGTPGMAGEKAGPYEVYAISRDGEAKVFVVE